MEIAYYAQIYIKLYILRCMHKIKRKQRREKKMKRVKRNVSMQSIYSTQYCPTIIGTKYILLKIEHALPILKSITMASAWVFRSQHIYLLCSNYHFNWIYFFHFDLLTSLKLGYCWSTNIKRGKYNRKGNIR